MSSTIRVGGEVECNGGPGATGRWPSARGSSWSRKGSSSPIATDVHRGTDKLLVEEAAQNAREPGCKWLHVDFDEDLEPFYSESCGFRPVPAGLIQL